ncbi:MAG: exosortase K [Pyrinomonadaceae bacterium]
MKIEVLQKLNRRVVAQGCVVFAIAFAAKLFYSTSSVDDLRWILAPTTFLVELITRETFWFESHAGYMSADHSFLIADSCSGVNFLIMAFLMLCFLKLRKALEVSVSWGFIPAVILAAYVSTVIANTVRITVAMRLHRMSPEMIWINPEQLHRLEGIFIYFGFLLFLFTFAENLEDVADGRSNVRRSLVRQSLIPLSIYWFTTLGIPVLNGAYRQGASFWEHSAFVLLTPMVLVLPLVAIRAIAQHRPSTASRPYAYLGSFRNP